MLDVDGLLRSPTIRTSLCLYKRRSAKVQVAGLLAALSPRPALPLQHLQPPAVQTGRRVLPSLGAPPSLPTRQSRALGPAPQHPDGVTGWWQSGADGRVGTGNRMCLLRLLVLRCSTKYLQLGSREGVNLSDLFFSLPFFFLSFDGIGCPCPHHPHCRILSKVGEISSGVVLTMQTVMCCPGGGPSSQGTAAARPGWAQALVLLR